MKNNSWFIIALIAYSLTNAIGFAFKKDNPVLKHEERLRFTLSLALILLFSLLFLMLFFIIRGFYIEALFLFITLLLIESLVFFIAAKLLPKSNGLFILYLPVSILFFISLSLTNVPSYEGALAGFGPPREWIASTLVFLLYPVHLFSLSRLRWNQMIIGAITLASSFLSLTLGISFSYPQEGFWADHGLGSILLIIGGMLMILGSIFIMEKRKTSQV